MSSSNMNGAVKSEYVKGIRHLLLRMSSILLRLGAVSVLFYTDIEFGRSVLLALSVVYLFQIIGGLELYLDANESRSAHFSKILSISIAVLPILAIYLVTINEPLFWVAFFLIDFLLIEISRKMNVTGEMRSSNMIAIGRSLVFLCAVVLSVEKTDFFAPVLVVGSLCLIMLITAENRKILTPIRLEFPTEVLRRINLIAISIAIINRAFDLIVRRMNSERDSYLFEYWDFYLSIFGMVNLATFYLFIAPMAGQILNGSAQPSATAYLFQPILVIASILGGALVFTFIRPGEFSLLYDEPTYLFLLVITTLVLAVFQVESWRIIGRSNNDSRRTEPASLRVVLLSFSLVLLFLTFLNISYFTLFTLVLALVLVIVLSATRPKYV